MANMRFLVVSGIVLLSLAAGVLLAELKLPRRLKTPHRLITGTVVVVALVGLTNWKERLDDRKESKTSPSPSADDCRSRPSDANLRLFPPEARRGQQVTIHGDGYPPDAAIAIFLSGRQPRSTGKLTDLPSTRADACGKFDQPWNVPDSVVSAGWTAVEITASAKAVPPDAGPFCCRASATLTVSAGS